MARLTETMATGGSVKRIAIAARRVAWARRWLGMLAAALLLAVLAAGLAAGPASAHAVLTGSEPAPDAVLQAAPTRMVLRFNEPVRVLRLVLTGPDAAPADLIAARAADGEVEIALPRPLRQGTQVLSWRVASADGHPVAGTLVFAVGAPSAGASVAAPGDLALKVALWATRLLLYGAALLVVGGAFFGAWIARGAVAPGRALVFAGLLAAVLLPGLQGLDLAGLSLADITTPGVWGAGLASGVALQAGLAAGAILLAATGRRVPAIGAVGLLAVAAAAAGHAATAAPQALMRPAMAVHIACLCVWLGSLPALLALLRRDPAALPPVLRRYALVVAPAFLMLLASGLVLAVVQVERVSALVTTPYGLILSGKLLLVAAVGGIAACNRWVLTPQFATRPDQTAPRLARAVRVELGLALAVLGLVMGWRFTPPPRALAAPAPLYVHIHDEGGMADLTLTPGRAGANAAAIVLQTGEFRPLAAKQVVLRAASPARGIEAIEQVARRDDAGVWRVDRLTLPLGGLWRFEIVVLVTDFQQLVLEDQAELPP